MEHTTSGFLIINKECLLDIGSKDDTGPGLNDMCYNLVGETVRADRKIII